TATSPAPLSRQRVHALPREISPRGRWRLAVRGLALSNSRSTIRLNAIAHVRAEIMAARIRTNILQPGHPLFSRAATAIEASAKGRAKTVCENLTNEPHFLIWKKTNIEHPTLNIEF